MYVWKTLSLFVILALSLLSCSSDTNNLSTSEPAQPEEKTMATATGDYETQEKPAAFASALKKVDQLPLFGGCEDWNCSNEKLINYIRNNLKYPEKARESELEGKVFIQFIVASDGSVTNTYIAKDIGGGCGAAAAALVNQMNDLEEKWSPGIHEGRPVDVVFTLPFTFALGDS